MSAAVFADTHYFIALLDSRDAAHRRVLAESSIKGRRYLTTEFILIELADGFCAAEDRNEFVALFDGLRTDSRITIIPASTELFARGYTLYRDRPDKNWSLTDCISFVVMADEGLTEALTGDHHFEQAGFIALLA